MRHESLLEKEILSPGMEVRWGEIPPDRHPFWVKSAVRVAAKPPEAFGGICYVCIYHLL